MAGRVESVAEFTQRLNVELRETARTFAYVSEPIVAQMRAAMRSMASARPAFLALLRSLPGHRP